MLRTESAAFVGPAPYVKPKRYDMAEASRSDLQIKPLRARK